MQFRLLITAMLMLNATIAGAHPGHGALAHGSLASGLLHPLTGLDHILAMVAVGLWAASLGGRATLIVPAAFVAAMSGGFLLALTGLSLPYVEPMILGSVVVMGLLVAAAVRLPLVPAALVVAAFAVFHGHAHGSEMGHGGAFAYAAGFVAATAALHLAGIGLAAALQRLDLGALPVRALGAVTAVTGVIVFVGG